MQSAYIPPSTYDKSLGCTSKSNFLLIIEKDKKFMYANGKKKIYFCYYGTNF